MSPPAPPVRLTETKPPVALRRKFALTLLLVVKPTTVPMLLIPLLVVGLPPGPSKVVNLVGVCTVWVVEFPLPPQPARSKLAQAAVARMPRAGMRRKLQAEFILDPFPYRQGMCKTGIRGSAPVCCEGSPQGWASSTP